MIKVISELPQLASQWMAILEHSCPPGWRKVLPTLNLAQPDRILTANPLPVLSFLPQMATLAPPNYRTFIKLLANLHTDLHFNQTYCAEDFGDDFLQQYGWIKFLGPDGYWVSNQLSSGLLLLGDNVTYPEHWHVAEELYLPLSGMGDWYHEDYGWQTKSPGEIITHASNVKHAIRTNGESLLLMYIWRGGDLGQKSEFGKG